MPQHPSQEIRFCRSRDGTRIAYGVCGKGPPLFFAPHWAHHLEYDWRNPAWRHWLALLTRHNTVIWHDWRGCGLSDRDDVELSFERYVEDYEAVIAAARLESFPIVGISNGAIFGAVYAARHPEQVTRLVLCGCQGRGRLTELTDKQLEEVHARWKVFQLGWADEHLAYRQFLSATHIPNASTEQRYPFNDLTRKATSPDKLVPLLDSLGRADLREILPHIRCPTLLLHARSDFVIPFDEGRMAAGLIPGARFVPLDTTNHILLDSEPSWRQFVELFNDFMPPPVAGPASQSFDDLSSREREVLEFVAQGLDNDGISARLKISEKTVRNHVSAIFSKLGMSNRAQVVAKARDAGYGRRTGR